MSSKFEPSQIKNKMKREDEARKKKRAKSKQKLEKRLEQAKTESKDPLAKKVRQQYAYSILNELRRKKETASRKCPQNTG